MFAIPAKAGIQSDVPSTRPQSSCGAGTDSWIPAFAGMTAKDKPSVSLVARKRSTPGTSRISGAASGVARAARRRSFAAATKADTIAVVPAKAGSMSACITSSESMRRREMNSPPSRNDEQHHNAGFPLRRNDAQRSDAGFPLSRNDRTIQRRFIPRSWGWPSNAATPIPAVAGMISQESADPSLAPADRLTAAPCRSPVRSRRCCL